MPGSCAQGRANRGARNAEWRIASGGGGDDDEQPRCCVHRGRPPLGPSSFPRFRPARRPLPHIGRSDLSDTIADHSSAPAAMNRCPTPGLGSHARTLARPLSQPSARHFRASTPRAGRRTHAPIDVPQAAHDGEPAAAHERTGGAASYTRVTTHDTPTDPACAAARARLCRAPWPFLPLDFLAHTPSRRRAIGEAAARGSPAWCARARALARPPQGAAPALLACSASGREAQPPTRAWPSAAGRPFSRAARSVSRRRRCARPESPAGSCRPTLCAERKQKQKTVCEHGSRRRPRTIRGKSVNSTSGGAARTTPARAV